MEILDTQAHKIKSVTLSHSKSLGKKTLGNDTQVQLNHTYHIITIIALGHNFLFLNKTQKAKLLPVHNIQWTNSRFWSIITSIALFLSFSRQTITTEGKRHPKVKCEHKVFSTGKLNKNLEKKPTVNYTFGVIFIQ